MHPLARTLLDEHVLPREAIEDALHSQSLYGGSLDTNLMELGLIAERDLYPHLERAFGVRNAIDPREQAPDRQAAGLLRADQAARYRVLPFRVVGRTLHVLTADPGNVKTLDEVGFVTGLRVQVSVATEMRVAVLLEDLYGVRCDLRFRQLSEGISWPKPEVSGRRGSSARSPGNLAEAIPALDWDDAGVDIAGLSRDIAAATAQAHLGPPLQATGPLAGAAAPAPTPTGSALAAPAPAPAPVGAPPAPAPVSALPAPSAPPAPAQAQAPAPAPAAPTPAPPAEAAPAPTALSGADPRAPMAAPEELAPTPTPATLGSGRARRTRSGRHPLPLTWLAEQLANVTAKDELPPLVLQYLLGIVDRAAMFTVQKDLVIGWDAIGGELSADQVTTLMCPLSAPSIFHDAAEAGVFIGPIPAGAVNDHVARMLGGTRPPFALVAPVRVKDRLVAFLYAEAQDQPALLRAFDDLRAIAGKMGETFIRIILSRKRPG